MKRLRRSDRIGYFFLGLVFVLALYFGFTDLDYFDHSFSVEDGPVEWGTTLALFCISILCLQRLFTLWSLKKIPWRLGTFMFALLFFFAAGEEISWGQRIFDIQSSTFFTENNAQGETNLHNLVVGGKKINKIVFSQLLMLVMVIYLLVAPVMYRKITWFKELVNKFAIPIVQWHHTIAFLISTGLVALNPSSRKWEVYELAFGVIFLLIFLYPLNRWVFTKENVH
ncbi:hypothetical protein [Ascidiimonas aurantiaca]|uniref:hypothetical protein n=1 Tax=Ascidiimonas aurantiaca TaxID=1685432 RepID=UPI0030EB72D1